ncbi:hypothetical protein EP7_001012 [Isosphaeraceae bacterium EP7]
MQIGVDAARILLAAARSLGGDDNQPALARFRRVAGEYEDLLRRPIGYLPIHEVSPFVIMRDGSRKTILAMIEESNDDDDDRLRLAQLLLRSLEWRMPR